MAAAKALITNRYFLAFVGLYCCCMALIVYFGLMPLEEPIAILIIMGLLFPGIAYWSTGKAQPVTERRATSSRQLIALSGCLLLMVLYLTWGKSFLEFLVPGESGHPTVLTEIVSLIGKLIFVVFIPFLIFRHFFNYRWRNFGLNLDFREAWTGHWRPLMVMVVIWLLFQYFVGSGAKPIRDGAFSATQLLVGMPLVFCWLVIEVGLVEEFFFRALLQEQLATWLRSDLGAIFLGAAIFGLAHAPGLYLRGAGAVTVLGETPSLLGAITYSIVVLSVAGLTMAIIWARTRNLLLLMIIHATGDLLPNYPEFLSLFDR
jgi:membrane protease YdiL (CAAX protease family)